MRIVHCIYNLDSGGGAENLLIDILNKMCITNKIELIIINTLYDKEMLDRIDCRVKIVKLNRKPGSRSIFPLIKFNWELIKFRAQVVHTHHCSIAAFLVPWPGRKSFSTIHALNIPMKYSGRITSLFAISNAVKADAESRTSKNVVLVPNGIKIEEIFIKDIYDYHYPNAFKIVNVARLEAGKKGQDILIKAIGLLRKEGFDVHVDFIGEGSSKLMLENLAQQYGVADCVRFLGLKSRTYIYQHLRDYDLMCHPSRYEGFGLTVAEGMAAGLPVLVSNAGGPYELIEYGLLGKSFKMESFEDCALQIKNIIQNYSENLKLYDIARNKITRNYSLDAMVEKYLCEYKK